MAHLRQHLLLLLSCLVLLPYSLASPSSESVLLLRLKASMSMANSNKLGNWTSGSKPCGGAQGQDPVWEGVKCDKQGRVYSLVMENMGLTGIIDIQALSGLSSLRTLSFINNTFDGPIPQFSKLGALKNLFLSNNKFSGEIPSDTFAGMGSLKKLYLANNDFSGPIPRSLAEAPKLMVLSLENNKLDGKLPNFRQKDWKSFNVSYNLLVGRIPNNLSKMDLSSFAGNLDLCGPPVATPCKPSKKLSTPILITIIIICIGVALGIAGTVLLLLRRRHRHRKAVDADWAAPATNKKVGSYDGGAGESWSQESQKMGGGKEENEQGRLVFVREDRERFELHDLLRASAQVLGSGSFGSSYKAEVMGGPSLVVKRFREMNGVGREEFHQHMRKLGRLRHPNLLPLVAFYYRKEEKLLVSDYVPNGSLVHLLHGKRGAKEAGMEWGARLKIVKGVARGLVYLYNELPNMIVPHGHLKSSNVLLTASMEPVIADYGLVPLINHEHATQLMVAYKSPEYLQYKRVTKKSDVWSLGILILEILTGKFPENCVGQGKGGADLASWVNSVVREEWTGEVFDSEMGGTKNAEGEMLKLLQVGLGCCEKSVEKRWDLSEAIDKIEELRERESDQDYSSYASEGDMYSSSRAMTEDEFSFSMNV